MQVNNCSYCNSSEHAVEKCTNIEKYMNAVQNIRKIERERWDRNHSSCPNCGSKNRTRTYLAPVNFAGEEYIDDVNYANCIDCGHHTMIKELLTEEVGILIKEFKSLWQNYMFEPMDTTFLLKMCEELNDCLHTFIEKYQIRKLMMKNVLFINNSTLVDIDTGNLRLDVAVDGETMTIEDLVQKYINPHFLY